MEKLIKVCGMKYPDNLEQLRELPIDWVGFIFYPRSLRYVSDHEREALLRSKYKKFRQVGVFVDQPADVVAHIARDWKIRRVQLHGDYSPDDCSRLQDQGFRVIKVFAPNLDLQWSDLKKYRGRVDYFLFDTSGPLPGGNGKTFDWGLLKNYDLQTKFILSGGIGPETRDQLMEFEHPKWAGIDLNSRFEIKPALKDVALLKDFVTEFRKAKDGIIH